MDFSSLFSSSDNLFKFLFVGGIVMVCFSMVYPLQKKQEIEIEINTYNREVEFLNKDIDDLHKQINECKTLSKSTINRLQQLSNKKRLNPTRSVLILKEMATLKQDFNKNIDKVEKENQEIGVKQIVLRYNKTKISLLQAHSNTYDKYSTWLLISGMIIGLAGLLFWSISTYNSEILKKEEIKKTRRSP